MASPARIFVLLASFYTWTSATSGDNNYEDELTEAQARRLTDRQKTTDTVTPGPGCQLVGCVSSTKRWSNPFCGGNEIDCTSQGKGVSVAAYVSKCPGESFVSKCMTGSKVQCQKCAPPAPSAPMPTPGASPALWNAPPPSPQPAVGQPQAISIGQPTSASSFPSSSYDGQGVNKSTLAYKSAVAQVSVWKIAYTNASNAYKKCQANVSKFTQLEKKSMKLSKQMRSQSVASAKKVAMSNITKGKVMKAMSGAYFAQKGASNSAQANLVNQQNAAAAKMFYQQQLIDVQEQRRQAQRSVQIANTAVRKAMSDLRRAKLSSQKYRWQTSGVNFNANMQANSDLKLAQRLAVDQEMAKAYKDASWPR